MISSAYHTFHLPVTLVFPETDEHTDIYRATGILRI